MGLDLIFSTSSMRISCATVVPDRSSCSARAENMQLPSDGTLTSFHLFLSAIIFKTFSSFNGVGSLLSPSA